MKFNLGLLYLGVILSACVSEYKGPMPDYSLRGEKAKQEIEKFQFAESYFDSTKGAFKMGPKGQAELYYSDSLKPLLQDVSPAAFAELERAEWWSRIWWVPYGIALGVLVLEWTDGDDDFNPASQVVFWSALGTSVGFAFYQLSVMQNSAKMYNRDLNSKFTPGLSYNFQF